MYKKASVIVFTALSLITVATPAFAASSAEVNANADAHADAGLHLGSIVRSLVDSSSDVRTDTDADTDAKGKADIDLAASVGATAKSAQTALLGVVNSITSTGFMLGRSVSASNAINVNTDASTSFRGDASSSASLSSGSKVLVIGTPDASGSITASVVIALEHGFGFFAHLLSF